MGCSPYKAFFGTNPHSNHIPVLCLQLIMLWMDLVFECDQLSAFLQEQLQRAQLRMKHKADKGRSERAFSVGESVFLKLQPYVQSLMVNRPYPKLAFKFFGPSKILEKVGTAAYRLGLPDHSLVHPVFHVSQLKPHVPAYTPTHLFSVVCLLLWFWMQLTLYLQRSLIVGLLRRGMLLKCCSCASVDQVDLAASRSCNLRRL